MPDFITKPEAKQLCVNLVLYFFAMCFENAMLEAWDAEYLEYTLRMMSKQPWQRKKM